MDSAVEAADSLNASQVVARSFERLHPDESVLYSAAAILVPGWSVDAGPSGLRRNLGLRRGTLVLTHDRLHFTSGRLSPMSLGWAAAFVIMVVGAVLTPAWPMLLFAWAPALLLVQRLPATRDLPWESIEAIEIRGIEGRIAPGYSLAVRVGGVAFRFNTNKQLAGEALDLVQSRGSLSV